MSITLTARTLIGNSLKLIGVLAEGESASGAMEKDCFQRLNELIDGWATQRLTQRVIARETCTLTPGTARYSIGTGGDIDRTRPEFIEAGGIILNDYEYPLRKLTESEFQSIPDKDLEGSPSHFYHDAVMPAAEVQLWPVPNAADTLVLYIPESLAQWTTPAASYTLAPAYARALRTNLALELAPEFGRPVEPWLVQQASDSLADLKRLNIRHEELQMPCGFVERATLSGRAFENL